MSSRYAPPIRSSRLSTDALSDPELVERAREGDRAALETLLRRHQPRVAAVCRRIIGDEADAADATQEALVAIVRGLSRFDGRSAFSTWVYRVATNASLDELRRRRRRPVLTRVHDLAEAPLSDRASTGSVNDVAAADPDAAGPIEQVATRQVLDAALARLPEEFRVAVVLRDVGDLDYAEIAEVLDIPPGTVRSRIARGRAALASMLGNPADLDGRPTLDEPQRPLPGAPTMP